MGIITISISEETERKLKQISEKLFGKRKGRIGKTIEISIEILDILREIPVKEFFERFSVKMREIKREELWQ